MTQPQTRIPAAATQVQAPGDRLAGLGVLLALALRRDRWVLSSWILGLAGMAAFSVAATKDLYPTEASRVSASETINATAALVALYGKIYDPASLGAISLIKLTAFGAAIVSIVFVFVVVRHSRAEEESGRMELVGAGAVGRAAPLAAALLLGFLGSLVLAAVTAIGLVAVGLPVAGSLVFGVGWGLTGIVFSAIAGVTAQLSTSARVASGLGMIAVGAAYALRAVGDLAEGDPGVLSWLSPIGWSQQLRPFAGDRWWIVPIPLVIALGLVVLANVLRAQRDFGAGMLPDRVGRDPGRLHGVVGLASRLQSGMFWAWAAGLAALGFVLGSVAHNVSGLLDSPQIQEYIGALGGRQGLTDAFLAAEIGIMGALVATYGVSAIMRVRTEESAGHAEVLLSTATTRARWLGSHALWAVFGVLVLLVFTGTAIGLGHGLATGDIGGQLPRMVWAAVFQAPAGWVMIGLVVLIFGWAPRFTSWALGLLVVFIVLGEFGVLWGLPEWVLQLSPFAHSPTLPGETVSLTETVAVVAVGVSLGALGVLGWQRRDLQPS